MVRVPFLSWEQVNIFIIFVYKEMSQRWRMTFGSGVTSARQVMLCRYTTNKVLCGSGAIGEQMGKASFVITLAGVLEGPGKWFLGSEGKWNSPQAVKDNFDSENGPQHSLKTKYWQAKWDTLNNLRGKNNILGFLMRLGRTAEAHPTLQKASWQRHPI